VFLLGKMPSYQLHPQGYPQNVGKMSSQMTFSDKKMMESVMKKIMHLTHCCYRKREGTLW
jgi:hypothetical protein